MSLLPPDMDDCEPKRRCLHGDNIGQVYQPSAPCPPGQTFNELLCDCEDLNGACYFVIGRFYYEEQSSGCPGGSCSNGCVPTAPFIYYTTPAFFGGCFDDPDDLGPSFSSIAGEPGGQTGNMGCGVEIDCPEVNSYSNLTAVRSDGTTWAGTSSLNSDWFDNTYCFKRNASTYTDKKTPLQFQSVTGYGDNLIEAQADAEAKIEEAEAEILG